MKESLSQQTANLKHKNNRHKRWKGIVSILACMVVFCTVYALILPALTAEGTPHCGKEEHTHTEDCYEKKLICGKEEGEGAHHHTDECYREEPVLDCTTPETDGHQQTDYCNLKDPFENACNDVTVRFERKLLLSELFSSVPSASIFFAFKIFSPQMSSFKKRPSLSFHKIPLYQKKDNYKYVLVLFKPVSYFTNSLTFALLPTRSLK